MKRPTNFDDLLKLAKESPDVHGALAQIGIHLKHVGYARDGERWQTATKSGTSITRRIDNLFGKFIALSP